MMDWTDRHCRYFHRLISKQILLYTEMVTTGALLHGDPHRFLQYHESEHPLALQLGGSDPNDLATCAKMAEDFGYDEVNLNIGCPSDRVQSGRFGACLMAEADLVGECISWMQAKVSIPVTVKCRIGIDDNDSYPDLVRFIETVAVAGCNVFIIHARKAILSGLSPKQNREIPPLRYDFVHRIKQDFAHLQIILNGGIKTIEQIKIELEHCDGVMMGREAYHNPYLLAEVDPLISGNALVIPSRHEIILELVPYIQTQLRENVRLHSISRHILGLFHGQPGARAWRQHISENAPKTDADTNVILQALNLIHS
jgi:tRNA-dihydrouridine synthase A